MSALVLNGSGIAAEIQGDLAREAAALRARGIVPGLAVVLVGEDPGSQIYVRLKMEVARRLGIESRDHVLPAATSQEDLLRLIRSLNEDPSIHGILVQSPVPPPLHERTVLNAVDPRKYVDGLHPFNMGALMAGPIPCPRARRRVAWS